MKKTILSILGIAALATAANAQLLVLEDFDYATGSLGSANGGTGWQSAWGNTFTFASNTVSGSSVASVVSGNLTNGANPFAVAGNSLSLVNGTTYRKFDDVQRITGNASDTLFFSFMAKPTNATGATFFKFVESSISGTYNVFEFGSNASSQWALGGAYGSGGGGSGNGTAAGSGTGAGAAFAINTDFFVIGKITTSNIGNDQAWVQVYGNTGVVSSTDNLSSSNLLNWSVNRTDGRASNILLVNSAVANIDGIRIGDSYASVIPEPSSFALLAGGLAGLAIFRRRRQS